MLMCMSCSCAARFMHPGTHPGATGPRRLGLTGGARGQLPYRCEPDSSGQRKTVSALDPSRASSSTSRGGPVPAGMPSTDRCQQRRCLPPASPATGAAGSDSAPVAADATRSAASLAAAAPSVVVTGASSGIGRAAAVHLASQVHSSSQVHLSSRVHPRPSAGKQSPSLQQLRGAGTSTFPFRMFNFRIRLTDCLSRRAVFRRPIPLRRPICQSNPGWGPCLSTTAIHQALPASPRGQGT